MFNVKIVGADQTSTSIALTNSMTLASRTDGRLRLYTVTVFNTGPDQYIQIFDAALRPPNGTVPLVQGKVLADTQISFDFSTGRPFALGICVCNSTASGSLTLGSNNCLIDVTYRVMS